MNRGYEEQQLDWEIQWVLDIPREMDLQPRNDQEKSAHIPGYLSSHLAIFENNYQTTSKYPSYVGATTKGFPFTTVNGLSLSEKFEGSLGQSRINIEHTQGTRALALWHDEM